jgi:hypothetical protein
MTDLARLVALITGALRGPARPLADQGAKVAHDNRTTWGLAERTFTSSVAGDRPPCCAAAKAMLGKGQPPECCDSVAGVGGAMADEPVDPGAEAWFDARFESNAEDPVLVTRRAGHFVQVAGQVVFMELSITALSSSHHSAGGDGVSDPEHLVRVLMGRGGETEESVPPISPAVIEGVGRPPR